MPVSGAESADAGLVRGCGRLSGTAWHSISDLRPTKGPPPVSALSAPLDQERERGAELCLWLEDFLEKLLCNPWITLYQIYEEGANFAFP